MEGPTFLELLNRNEEFVFSFENVNYEIVMGDERGEGHKLSLFLSDGFRGTYLETFNDKFDLLNNGMLKGKKIKDVIKEIKVK